MENRIADVRKITFAAGMTPEMRTESGGTFVPDDRGVILQYEVELPEFETASYFAPFQKYDPIPGHSQAWPDGCNRIQPLAIRDFHDLAKGGHFLLLKLQGGGYAALLAVAGPKTIAWFSGTEGRLLLEIGTFGSQPVEADDIPLCVWAEAADPYAACRRVWEAAVSDKRLGGSTRMRERKQYPEPFRYLGWCSWEEYKFDINEQMLLQALESIEMSGLPVRYALIDDGHLHADAKRRLISFRPDESKFPNGWSALLNRRSEDRIKWMGLWLNFNGYWGGISPDHELGELESHIEQVPGDRLQPKNAFLDSFAFYDAMIGSAREAGFDFVKVDNQAQNAKLNTGTDNGTERAANNAQALEAACARHMDGLINCMAHNALCIFNTRISAVTRCSEDYAVGELGRARRHLHNSYGNIPWLGQTVWGDHDMFHSGDQGSGQIMAVSKAMSGGPIYLSDNPARFDAGNVLPLCYSDGELLRPIAPAAPLRECLFDNPLEGEKPYAAIAPLQGAAAAVVVYNLSEPEVPLTGSILPEHYADAGCMLQSDSADWEIPAEGLLLYDWLEQRASRLTGPYRYELPGYGHQLFQLSPIRYGWSVIGRIDKYLPAAAAEVIFASVDELVILLRESGPVAVWSESGRLEAGECEPTTDDGQLWRFALPAGERNAVLQIRRQRGRSGIHKA